MTETYGYVCSRRRLVARLPGRSRRPHFAKEDFLIDVVTDTCTCPAGNVREGAVPGYEAWPCSAASECWCLEEGNSLAVAHT